MLKLFTNLIAYNKLKVKGVFINGRNYRLEKSSKIFYFLPRYKGYTLIKNNTAELLKKNKEIYATFTTKAQSSSKIIRTAVNWYTILKYVLIEVIEHFPILIKGVEVKQGILILKINKYEPCALLKARNIISRNFAKIELFTRLF